MLRFVLYVRIINMIFIHLELEASEADAAQHAEQVAGRRRQGVQQLH